MGCISINAHSSLFKSNLECYNLREMITFDHPISFNCNSCLMKGRRIDNSKLLFIRFSFIKDRGKERLEKKLGTIYNLQPKLTYLVPYLYIGNNYHYYYLVIDDPGYESLNQALINNHFKVTEFNLCIALRGIIETLVIMHNAGICHGQIAPEKILVHNNIFYLFDPVTGLEHTSELLEECKYYAAPAVLNGESPSPLSDVWSLGALIYYLITGHTVYAEAPISQYLNIVNAGDPSFSEPVWSKVSPELVQMLKKMLKKCEHRITMDEIRSSHWLNVIGLTGTTNLTSYIKKLRNELSAHTIIKSSLYLLANEMHRQKLEGLLAELQLTDYMNTGKIGLRFLLEKVLDPDHKYFNILNGRNFQIFYKRFMETSINFNKLVVSERMAAIFYKHTKNKKYIEKEQIKAVMIKFGFSVLLDNDMIFEQNIKLIQEKKRYEINLTFEEFITFFEERRYNFSEEIIFI